MLNRRDLLTGAAPLAAAGWIGLSALVAEAQEKDLGEAAPYTLPPLPYAYEALEPAIDAQTMKLHHDIHHAGYVKGLNAALDKLAEARKSGDYAAVKALSREVAFHGSGHLLHCCFWTNMTPAKTEPKGRLSAMIARDFGSMDAFKAQFGNAAKQVEGSGWGILAFEPLSKRLLVLESEKHQNLTVWGVHPLLVLDVWEHAYYLKYQNRRPEYVDAFWNVVNWNDVAARLDAAMK
jgi:Fe-Mn family superoxide dismutase